MRTFQSPAGVPWSVEVTNPGASNAIVLFRHPTGRTARLDRYAQYNANRPEARDVTARLDPEDVLRSLTDAQLALLFRRSMLVSAADTPLTTPITHAG